MELPIHPVIEFLRQVPGFTKLSDTTLSTLAGQFQPLRYPMGRTILTAKKLPTQFYLIYSGQVRLIGYDPRTQTPLTLQRLERGTAVGWLGLVRQHPCETAIASSDTVCLTLPAETFLQLLAQEPAIAVTYQDQCGVAEIFDILGLQLVKHADGSSDLKALTLNAWPQAVVQIQPPGTLIQQQLDAQYRWYISSNSTKDVEVGQCISDKGPAADGHWAHTNQLRLVGLPPAAFVDPTVETVAEAPQHLLWDDIPEATHQPPEPELPTQESLPKYPFVSGRGPVDAPLACFQMLAQYWNLPFRRDVIRRILNNQLERTGTISLSTCGAIAELMGLKAQLVNSPAPVFNRLPTPALIHWQGDLTILYHNSPKQMVLGVPGQGIRQRKPETFLEDWGESGEVLLLETTPHTPQKRFGLSWFLPSIGRYRKVLIEVLIASFFVNLFALAQPLGIQVIIDKVLVQNSVDTLNVLGVGLLVIAIFEALLSAFRTYLFVDTTNRIDMTLGAQVIDHLVRLPLGYFDRRPVGELTTRINELENIRKFLTGTALTVVLDAIFSVIYIIVMLIYSWLLTLVALATVPLFALMTLIFAPIIRQQVRTKAERNAETQSHLVEVLAGIQTVKAQNIELKSRWQWQERYARYVSAGFKAVITSTTAGSMSGFLNKLSGLLLLWIGVLLVLDGQLTLGQLIAFRIIAGYTTSPLLRLIQLWQNFQETALSLERLADILDNPQEETEEDRENIPLPPLQGAVSFKDISFRFKDHAPLVLQNINLDFSPGMFIGIAGQSGSGKSTLMKLLMRLYDPVSGQILMDRFDVGKVELYSLRGQIGMVLQDSLLFDGTVQDNIALPSPQATSDEIVEAAKIAYAHDFIMELPQGYNSRVGERGSALSGGQRQRIAIARMVLQNPRLIILDEATSALDYNAERQVIQNLMHTFGDRTVFFITHRLKTLEAADIIVMMDQGRVVEQGTHPELMDLKERYYWLYQQQESQA